MTLALSAPIALAAQHVSGLVLRGGSGEPVADATVALLDGSQVPLVTATTDPEGRFRLEAPGAGVYSLSIQHDGYAALWREDLSVDVLGAIDLELSLSPLAPEGGSLASESRIRTTIERAVATSCGEAFDPAANGVLTGRIVDEDTEVPLPGVPVSLVWRDPADSIPDVPRSRAVLTDENGIYLFCDAPGGMAVLATVAALGRDEVVVTVGIESGALHREDFALGLNDPTAPGFLFGSVFDPSTARPVAGVDIRIRDTAFRAMTDENGFFSIADVPWGIYLLDASHIAYRPVEQAFRVHGSRGHLVDIAMSADAIELEPLTVSVRPRRWFSDMEGMKRRQMAGFGHFISPRAIELRGASRLSDVLREVPGVRVRPAGVSGSVVVMRGTGPRGCVPQVFVDGRLYRPDPYLGFNEPFGTDLYAIEVYTGPASVPAEFAYGNNPCGAVVVWTKRGR
jgi:hypothetical protein